MKLPKSARASKLASGLPVRVDLQRRESPEYEARQKHLFFHVVAQLAGDDGEPCCRATPDGLKCSRRDGLPHYSMGRGLSIPCTAIAAYGKEWLEEQIAEATAKATEELENYRAAMRLAKEMREPESG